MCLVPGICILMFQDSPRCTGYHYTLCSLGIQWQNHLVWYGMVEIAAVQYLHKWFSKASCCYAESMNSILSRTVSASSNEVYWFLMVPFRLLLTAVFESVKTWALMGQIPSYLLLFTGLFRVKVNEYPHHYACNFYWCSNIVCLLLLFACLIILHTKAL